MNEEHREDWRTLPRTASGRANRGVRGAHAAWGRLDKAPPGYADDIPPRADAWRDEELEELIIRMKPALADRAWERPASPASEATPRGQPLSESWVIRVAIVLFVIGPFVADALMGREWWLTAVGWGYVGFAASLLFLLGYHAWTMRPTRHTRARRALYEWLDEHAVLPESRAQDNEPRGPRRA